MSGKVRKSAENAGGSRKSIFSHLTQPAHAHTRRISVEFKSIDGRKRRLLRIFTSRYRPDVYVKCRNGDG